MNREYHHWYSPRLGRDMEFLVFGHAGAKVLVFPTRDGRFFEYENLGIVERLRNKIEAGYIQLYCVDSIDHETFYCFWRKPQDRIQRHIDFEDYVLNEIMPFMALKNPHPCVIAHGCSLGAFHAANIAFRHPHLFRKLVAFSGRFDLTLEVECFKNLFDGYYDENIYFHTPSHFLPNLACEAQLSAIRRMEITLVIGKQDPFLANNHALSRVLAEKNVPHALYEWEGRAHQGHYWRRMAPLYL
ncbi:alpha/beta hydrolase-fold protein [Methylomonas sp. EFPC3]|uniref:esterase family protein n=1 Tax=Methylomonas sp. EFPC3 TaxID=3021710 RepID=UPI002417BA6B|nr:alpha/beta hydrolase-fold protein [Methylomonas sp. EFPC3]WFP51495.1 alpha/beta hydrolase-fold protein [Methylomonas sp. EFPC3]